MAAPTGLAARQLRALDRLNNVPGLQAFYLAGGSAIAYHLQHRQSVDIDLFSDRPDVELDSIRGAIVRELDAVEVVAQSDAALKLIVEGTEVDLVRYPYSTLTPPEPGPRGYRVAGILDLAAMKLAAISSRGIQRDFWDLYVIVQSGPTLVTTARAYVDKFGTAESNLYHVMRALTFFDDADREQVRPEGLSGDLWARIKSHFRATAPQLLDDLDPDTGSP